MIGTIRKHSGWLWAIIIAATIVSFIYWGTNSNRVGGGGSGEDANPTIVYGKKVSREQYAQGKRDFVLSYWFRTGKWPTPATITPKEEDQQIYLEIMLDQKAEQLGIHVSEDTLAAAASQRLAAMGRNGQSVTLDMLMDQALAPEGFTKADFVSYIRNDLVIQELIQALGVAGKLITPQEAAAAYQRENEKLATEAVFFDASNYLAYVQATPAVVGQFYTNYQAEYRLPDRVQVDYVAFNVSNYLAQSRAEWAKTNLSDFVENYVHKLGENYKGATNVAQARAIITEELVEQRAGGDAHKDANDLATAAFGIEPTSPQNLMTAAKQKGLVVHRTQPFGRETGPSEFDGSGDFAKAAFELTADSPLAGPFIDGDSVYVIALAKTLPSEIPSFTQIKARVTSDYEIRAAMRIAQQSALSFVQSLTNQLAKGQTFTAACAAAGHPALVLPPFSIITEELPELSGHATLAQIKQVAFTTPVGKTSGFEPTQNGGFVLYVKAKMAPEPTKLAGEMPQFTANLRRNRQNEAFNEWVQTEATANLHIPADK